MFEVKKNLFQSDYELVKTFNLNNNIYESQLLELLSFLRFMLFDGDINILGDTYKWQEVNADAE